MARIAFDIDDTLWKVRVRTHKDGHKIGDQIPDYDLIQVLRWFVNNGDEVFVWSAGGVDYAKMIVEKLGLDEMVTVIPKGKFGDRSNPADIDLTFDDDKEEKIGRVNITVFRNHGDLTSSE